MPGKTHQGEVQEASQPGSSEGGGAAVLLWNPPWSLCQSILSNKNIQICTEFKLIWNDLQRALTPGTKADTGALIHWCAEEVGEGCRVSMCPTFPCTDARVCSQTGWLTTATQVSGYATILICSINTPNQVSVWIHLSQSSSALRRGRSRCVCTSMWVSRLPIRSGAICCLQPLKLTSKDCSRHNAALIHSSQFAKLSFNISCLIKTTRNSVWILIVCLCCIPAAGQFQRKKTLIYACKGHLRRKMSKKGPDWLTQIQRWSSDASEPSAHCSHVKVCHSPRRITP